MRRLLDLVLGGGHPSYLCAYVVPVVCHYVKVAEHVPPIESALTGRENGDELKLAHHVMWHSEQFVRDDIDDPAVLNGLKRIEIRQVTRTYLPVEAGVVWRLEGRLAVFNFVSGVREANRAGFFAGGARTALDAMRWVASGEARHLINGGRL